MKVHPVITAAHNKPLRRTNADKRKAAEVAIGARPDLSPEAIGQHWLAFLVSRCGKDRMKKIYSSGPMTGRPEFYFPAFHSAAAELRAAGHDVVNPAELNPVTGGDWKMSLRGDIAAMCACDAVALLPGWQTSSGAHLEVHVAHRLGLEIRHVHEWANARNQGLAPKEKTNAE